MNEEKDSILAILSFKWRMILGVLIGLCIMFVIMVITCIIDRSSTEYKLNDLRNEVRKLEEENKIFIEKKSNVTKQLKNVTDEEEKLIKILIEQRKKITEINDEITKQNIEIPQKFWNDIYWLLGFLPSTGIGGFLT